MQVTVKFFAGCREAAGVDEATVTLAEGATIAALQDALAEQIPKVARYAKNVRYSVNWEYVTSEAELGDGDEVAMIPPVAGGTDVLGKCWITTEPVSEADVRPLVETPESGAVVVFLGIVRNHAEGRGVDSLEYEAYPPMAEQKMSEISEEARERWPLHGVAVVHRVGHLEIGEASIAIAVSSAHRAEAFAACEFVMDRVKEDAPIWKKEHWSEGGARWVDDPSV